MPPLRALVAGGHDVALVVTRADKRRGRGSSLVPSPVKAAAAELGVPVAHRVDAVLELDTPVEVGVVVAFGQLVKPHVLERVPMVNLHFSLLPRWRGAAPVERALLAGDDETGVCLMALDEGLDTGPVYECVSTAIAPDDDLGSLRARLVDAGTRMLVARLASGLGTPRPQEGEPTYAAKIEPGELRIDWGRAARDIDRLVRLGRAWTTFRERRLRVLSSRADDSGDLPPVPSGTVRSRSADGAVTVACGDATGLELLTVQPEGKQPMSATAWANGARPWSDVLGAT